MGQPTRGKTASNRLRRVDNFILLYEPSLLTRTTLESAARFRRVNPNLHILGVEAALPYADDKTFFRLGGFNLPLKDGETVRLIRAFNVLRQYEEKDFIPAYEKLAQYILPQGLMIEGTSNPFGSIWCANVVRKILESDSLLSNAGSSTGRVGELEIRDWRFEALVFSTNFRSGFDVEEFQTVLPKNLIHHVVKGEPSTTFSKRGNAPPRKLLLPKRTDQNNGLLWRLKTWREKGLK